MCENGFKTRGISLLRWTGTRQTRQHRLGASAVRQAASRLTVVLTLLTPRHHWGSLPPSRRPPTVPALAATSLLASPAAGCHAFRRQDTLPGDRWRVSEVVHMNFIRESRITAPWAARQGLSDGPAPAGHDGGACASDAPGAASRNIRPGPTHRSAGAPAIADAPRTFEPARWRWQTCRQHRRSQPVD